MYNINKHTEIIYSEDAIRKVFDFSILNNSIYLFLNKSKVYYYEDNYNGKIPLYYTARYINGNTFGINLRKYV